MKILNYQTVEVLSIEELAAVKGGGKGGSENDSEIGIPTPIIIPLLAAASLTVNGKSNFGLNLSHGAADGKHEGHKK